MKIETAPPFVHRGVTQLMYVGDDDAVEKAIDRPFFDRPPFDFLLNGRMAPVTGAVAALVALQSRGITRLAAGGIAALMAYRVFKSDS